MTKEKLIQFLRSAVHIQDPDISNDSKYLAMSDEDIELYLTIVMSRDYPNIRSLDDIPTASVYPIILLAKKELYYALAVLEAPLYDLGADNNNYLKREQRFKHYMQLIEQVNDEYDQYNENNETGTNGTLVTYDVLLNNRYYTPRYKNKGVAPQVVLYADNVEKGSVDLSWEHIVVNFAEFRVYLMEGTPVYDPYNLEEPINKDAQLIFKVKEDIHSSCRISDLKENTLYYVCLVYYDKCGLKGYSQITVDTTPTEDGGD